MTMTVRPAMFEDIPWMLDQLKAFDAFLGNQHKVFPDKDVAYMKLDELVTTQPIFVAETEGHHAGFIAGILHPHFFNPEIMTLTELMWWVSPEYRGSRAGALLFQAFVELGEREADWIVMTLEAKSPVNPATLIKRGFALQESSYLKEILRPLPVRRTQAANTILAQGRQNRAPDLPRRVFTAS